MHQQGGFREGESKVVGDMSDQLIYWYVISTSDLRHTAFGFEMEHGRFTKKH